jgi:hypothetical protein
MTELQGILRTYARECERAALPNPCAALLRTQITERFYFRPINYLWQTPDGTTHRGRTCVLSRTRRGLAAALRRFWQVNPHVSRVP